MSFSVRDDGQVDAHIESDRALFNDALGDCISSLPPRGADGVGPSTYWIDYAIEGARRAVEASDDRPFTSENITVLRVRDGRVVANYDYDEEDEPGEAVPIDEFLKLLHEWRERVLASASSALVPLPDTYRRNPFDSKPRRA